MTLMKICGLTRAEDVAAAVAAGADYLGFIMAESPRRVTAADVSRITTGIPAGAMRVGVFVNASEHSVAQAADQAGLEVIQLHGDESPAECLQIRRTLDLPVIKALRLRRPTEATDPDPADLVDSYDVDYLLIEPYVEGRYGGTGVTADWSLAAELVRRFTRQRFFLAGGLNPDNVAEALEIVGPFAVDASSGLEAARRIKDHEKIKRFAEVVKNQ